MCKFKERSIQLFNKMGEGGIGKKRTYVSN
jgi:hypothetical protein